MRFNILCDADWESGIDKVLSALSGFGYRRIFDEKDYGSSIDGITIILMCKNPEFNFKQRIKHSKKEKKVYMDIMFDLYQFSKIEQKEREKIVAQRLISEVPSIIGKYKFEDFDLVRFTDDLKKLLEKNRWL
ncbi:hypothetical protein [Mucilaginibacter sp.]|uniref:hypothetical protein n=1 Tax=Mucilaginibacter sp. TaxID=1882438 RepID=UPI0025E26E7A|nr:hypothetical protein [Mucilaginibacter sp.]